MHIVNDKADNAQISSRCNETELTIPAKFIYYKFIYKVGMFLFAHNNIPKV